MYKFVMGRNEEETTRPFSTVPSDRTRLKQLELHLVTAEDIFYCESGQRLNDSTRFNIFPFIHRSSPAIPSHKPTADSIIKPSLRNKFHYITLLNIQVLYTFYIRILLNIL